MLISHKVVFCFSFSRGKINTENWKPSCATFLIEFYNFQLKCSLSLFFWYRELSRWILQQQQKRFYITSTLTRQSKVNLIYFFFEGEKVINFFFTAIRAKIAFIIACACSLTLQSGFNENFSTMDGKFGKKCIL